MNRIYSVVVFCLMASFAFAQDGPYQSTSNPYYWKNRKPFEGYWQQDVDYTIKAKLDDSTDIVTATETLVYTNNSPDTLYFVYFHLYQNAFVKGSYLQDLNKANEFYQKFGRYEKDGKGTTIDLIEVTSNGATEMRKFRDLTDSSQANRMDRQRGTLSVEMDNTIMKVTLPAPLLPSQQATIKIDFKTYFDDSGNQRRRMKLFKDAWGNKQYDGVHWYPRICVYDRKFGWETDQHLGKEFYGDFGKFDVELTLPKQYVLDATGVLQNRDEVLPADLREKLDVKNFKDKPLESQPSEIIKADGTSKTWKFKSINTHDFAWVADPTFRIGETVVTLNNGEKVSCISLSQEPHSAKWQDAAPFTAKVIETYSRDIGNYAYPKMIVADARDGMEYPMLTLDGGLSPGYYGLLAHEVGHNWFFGMVGNNETYRASLDEGFTQFLTNWSMTSIFGEVKPTKENPHPLSRMDQTVYLGYLRDAMKNEDMPLNTHSDDFNGALNHGGGYGHVYYKTATMLYNLQYVLGDTLFLAAMQHYFGQWKMAHPYFDDFRSSIINFTHADLNWFFDQWMETTKHIDYRVEGVKKGSKELAPNAVLVDQESGQVIESNGVNTPTMLYRIKFRRVGDMQMPIDFTITGEDSTQRFNFIIPNTYFVKSHDAKTIVLPVWKGWGNLNETYEAKVLLPSSFKGRDVRIDPTYRLADIYQPDNSNVGEAYMVFDKGRKRPMDRRNYVYEWRPDIWYNSVDGLKAGLHLEGNYMNHRDVLKATVWYNTTLANNYGGSARRYLDYNFSYRNAISKGVYGHLQFRSLDGMNMFRIGNDIEWRKTTVEIYWKWFIRSDSSSRDYLLYPAQWNTGKANSSLNIDITRPYSYKNGSGELKEGFRGNFLSNYDYSRLYVQWINHHKAVGLELHSRVYAHLMAGSNIAPESQVYLSGSNGEDMMENKFIRSRGFVPTDWLGYGNNYNHFQAGGGLNIRGYAGYLVPRTVENTQVYMYKGMNGGALNLELDVDGLIPFRPKGLANLFHLDAYLFCDGGLLSNTYKSGEFGFTSQHEVETGLMVSSGAGFALTVKKWGKMDKAKPLTIRFDMPVYLSNSPYADGEFLRYRWVMGINRSF